MKRPTLSLILYLTLVFLSGVLVGAVGTGLYGLRSGSEKSRSGFNPEDLRRRYVEEMQTRLKLRPDQLQRLNGILDETRERYRDLREKYRPEVKGIQDEQARKIRSILDPGQQAEYEKMREERERHRQPPNRPSC